MAKKILLILFVIIPFLAGAQPTEIKYLTGTDNNHTVQWDFFCSKGRNSAKWTKIEVPSHWEQKGFGTYNYGHDKNRADEQGFYKYEFDVPTSWKNKNIIIVFEGSMTDTEVKINGKLAGAIHQGAFYEFSYNITPLLKLGGKNLLEVKVSKESADKSVNEAERDADYWIFGGIFRPVYLKIVPKEFIERVAIDAQADGSFAVEVFVQGIKNANLIAGQIKTLDGTKVGSEFTSNVVKNQDKVILKTKITNPKTWSAEFPNLYQIEIELRNAANNIHSVNERFGFRTVEVRRFDGIYVNGQKIKFRGVCRHSFYPTSGRCLNKTLSITDVNLMKDMNMNAVRMSHYPPDKHFLDVCDSLGLFVLDELAGWQYPPYYTEIGKKLVKELVVRDVNHPSIVLWDNGNEGGWNPELDADFALYDPQKRHVIHPWMIFDGTDTQHYRTFGYGAASHFNGREIFFPTEFLHGLYDGGHGAGLDDYWNMMLINPLSAGGFLWVFADEGLVRTDKNDSIDTDYNHAPDGIVGPYREKEGSFFTIKEIWSPVYIESRIITPLFDGRLTIENRFHHTNLQQCSFEWKLVNFPKPSERLAQYTLSKKGKLTVPTMEPGTKGIVKLELPSDWNSHDALYITATDPHGREIYTWTFPIKRALDVAKIVTAKSTLNQQVTVAEDSSLISLSANGVTIQISKRNGLLLGATNEKTSISLSNGPLLTDCRAKFKELKHYRKDMSYVVEALWQGDDEMSAVWTMHANGWLQLDYTYNHTGTFDYVGVNFDYPEEKITGITWLGRGPYRVWKNRLKGQQFGVWQKNYNNTVTGETWDYPEFKGYHSELYWVTIENTEYPFTVVSATDDIFLRILTPQTPKWSAKTFAVAPFPDGNISFMHAIPAIGTKFHAAEEHGPQSDKNKFYPVKDNKGLTATLFFNFGISDK